MNLSSLRDEIDKIDCELVKLFCARMDLSRKVGEYKRENSLPIQDEQREKEKLQSIKNLCSDEYSEAAEELYRKIFELSRDTQRMKCGLLGEKLGHSYSPQIHAELGEYEYRLYEKAPDEVESFIKDGCWNGLNVTIPYKKTVLPMCSVLSERAKQAGSVNTLVRLPQGGIYGDNTDVYGFECLVKKLGVDVKNRKALVFGSGGASGAVCAVLKEAGVAQLSVISRHGQENYTNLSRHSDAEIIVNATPLGMYPDNGRAAVDLRLFPKCIAVFDLVYNPARTELIMQAERLNIPCIGGLYMLVSQAKGSSERFLGKQSDNSLTDGIYSRLSFSMENIVLVGMPGCGKTTVGAELSRLTGRKFYDSDAIIEKRAGMTVPEIFEKFGEDGFRKLETEVLAELGKMSGAVIATGGGAVTREENYPLLHQNSRIVWIKRDLSLLPSSGRPISMAKSVQQLYSERESLYMAFSDFAADNDKDPRCTANRVLEVLK